MEILYEDRDAAVCVKPVGLDSEKEVPAALTEALGGDFFPIHRLDRNVGGVMVFARNRKTAAALSRAVQEGEMVKEYLAVGPGVPPNTRASWFCTLPRSTWRVSPGSRRRKGTGRICCGRTPAKTRCSW